ncbi:MAG: hypothetical protein V4633_06680 [Pseudomonadota bacterium]
MKLDVTKKWHRALVLIPLCVLIDGGFMWLLLNTHYGYGMPYEIQIGAPIFIGLVTFLFFFVEHSGNQKKVHPESTHTQNSDC